ncbi:MAG: hypothetical protein E7006_00415 [Alphaproteobacteria bacterium]|nr:hypothetical protein [Alphaproteobacteria bacterium]
MKIKCDFCKTEYSLDGVPSSPVKCAICGHVWHVAPPARKNSLLMFFTALCALLSAIVFAIAVITHHQASQAVRGPLVASVTGVTTDTDENGVSYVTVCGAVTNVSDAIYGVPDLIIILSDGAGRVLSRQKFMPSATLLDVGASVDFCHKLTSLPAGVKKISATLADLQLPQGDQK